MDKTLVAHVAKSIYEAYPKHVLDNTKWEELHLDVFNGYMRLGEAATKAVNSYKHPLPQSEIAQPPTTCAVCHNPMEDKGAAEHWCSDECYAKRARSSVDNGVIKALELIGA